MAAQRIDTPQRGNAHRAGQQTARRPKLTARTRGSRMMNSTIWGPNGAPMYIWVVDAMPYLVEEQDQVPDQAAPCVSAKSDSCMGSNTAAAAA